jgi:hypothetical protein
MSRYRYFFFCLCAAQALGSPLPAWAISDTAFSNMSGGGLIWAILLFFLSGLGIPLLISWATYRVLQRRQPDHEAPLVPILAASFLTYLVGNLIMNFVMPSVWSLLFAPGIIIGAAVLGWNLTRKPLPQ